MNSFHSNDRVKHKVTMKLISTLMLMWLLWIPARGKFVKEVIFIGHNVTEAEVSVTVQCHIQGNLRWFYTDDQDISVSVRVSGETLYHINATDIYFSSSPSAVSLNIQNRGRYEHPAAVTGTGSQTKLALPMLLLLVLMAAAQGHVRLSLLLVVTGSLSQSVARDLDETNVTNEQFVDIEIRAPRRFRYKSVNLFVKDGTLRVRQAGDIPLNTTRCKSSQRSSGCDACCSSRGICVEDICQCDPGFDPLTSCRTLLRQDIMFVHPLDPRLSATALPDGDTLTMYKQSLTSSRDSPSDVNIDLVPHDSAFDLIQLAFHPNGFLRRLHSHSGGDSQITTLRRNSRRNCFLSITIPNRNQVNICDVGNTDTAKSSVDFLPGGRLNSIHRLKSARRISIPGPLQVSVGNNARLHPLTYGIHFVDVPVKEYKCGETVPLLKPVSFHLQPLDGGNTGHFLYKQSAALHTYTLSGREGTFLRLPNISQELNADTMSGKCRYVQRIRANICLQIHFHVYNTVCNVLRNGSAHGSPLGKWSEFEFICKTVIPSLRSFCDITNKRNKPSTDCLSAFTNISNLFEQDSFSIRPVEDSLNGNEDVRISPSVVSIKDLALSRRPEIVMRDDRPAFKIVGITVIPKDPLPSDIYQVRLDYECATNATVIRMNVTGSDKYTNHVTCKGTTECQCCILHAAGAANAVVDHIYISIFDTQTKLEIDKEMVVIF